MKTVNYLLFLLVVSSITAVYTEPSVVNKARAFQSALNRAVSQQDERAINKLLSDWMVFDRCHGPSGDKRDFVRFLLAERKLGVVTHARDDGTLIHYDLNFGYKKMRHQIGSKEYPGLPRTMLLAKEIC